MSLHLDMPELVYHERPELSSTGARSLLPEFKGSPARFKWEREHPRASRAFDIGHAVHARVLGVGLQAVAYPDELLASNGAASTKAAKDWAAEQRGLGFVPMKRVEVNTIRVISEAVLADRDARRVFESMPHREASIITQSPEGVPVRARFDLYGNNRGADLKTTTDASPRGFLHSVMEYGYYVQQAWYEDAHLFETGSELESFEFVCVETTGPYHVAVYPLDALFDQIGRALTRRARDIYAECMATNEWPGITGEVLTPPNWLLYEHETEIVTT